MVDTKLPLIQQITATPNVLWPPNNALVPVEVGVSVACRCEASASCRIVAVGSNEPCTDRGPNPDAIPLTGVGRARHHRQPSAIAPDSSHAASVAHTR